MLGAVLALLLCTPAHAQSWSALPDWSGDWVVQTGAADPPAPYRAEWKAKAKAAGADPFKTCGLPAGAPRMMGVEGVHEFIVRPGEVWHAVEDGNTVQRIYTDGRQHPQGDDLFPTYTGDNIGHWDGQALTIDTVGLRDDTWLGPKLPHSDQTHVVTTIHKAGALLEATIRIEDPVAFTAPWTLVRRYRRLPAGSYVHDFACSVVRTKAQADALN